MAGCIMLAYQSTRTLTNAEIWLHSITEQTILTVS